MNLEDEVAALLRPPHADVAVSYFAKVCDFLKIDWFRSLVQLYTFIRYHKERINDHAGYRRPRIRGQT